MQRRRLTSTVNDWNIDSSKLQTFLNSLNCVEIEDVAQVGNTTIRGGEPTGRQQMFLSKRTLKVVVRHLVTMIVVKMLMVSQINPRRRLLTAMAVVMLCQKMMAQNLGSNLRQLHHQEYSPPKQSVYSVVESLWH
jgi:hypothetical protein